MVPFTCAADGAQDGDAPVAGWNPPGPPLQQSGHPVAAWRSVSTERRTELSEPRTTFGLDFLNSCAQVEPTPVFALQNNGGQAPGCMLSEQDRGHHSGAPCLLSDGDWLSQEPLDEGLPWFGPDSMASYGDHNNDSAAYLPRARAESRATAQPSFLSTLTAPTLPDLPAPFHPPAPHYMPAPAPLARACDAETPFDAALHGGKKAKADRFHPKSTSDTLFHWVQPQTPKPNP
ncbi:hypothetical protein T484DRAFT_3630174 [Baffinella frigidus]|nr:hypothetical protein T484DRAFT_3630174 [Cryptophyta sp. CCMP2293]